MNKTGVMPGGSEEPAPGVEGIILAAGLSRRAGVFKMTLDVYGKTVLARCIEGMYDACSRIIVVGGYRSAEILPVIDEYSKAELVFNENYMDGMYSSVKKGLKHIMSGRFFLTPGDYALVSPHVYESLLNVRGDIVVPSYEGKNGHPILMISSFIGEILSNPAYCSLKDFICQKGFTSAEVGDKGVLIDLDTQEDYGRVCEVFAKCMRDHIRTVGMERNHD